MATSKLDDWLFKYGNIIPGSFSFRFYVLNFGTLGFDKVCNTESHRDWYFVQNELESLQADYETEKQQLKELEEKLEVSSIYQ